MRRQIVVLYVTYDEDNVKAATTAGPPADWAWAVLTGEDVEVMAGGPVEQVTPIEAEIRRRLREE